MMKIIKKIKSSKASVTLVWVLGILVIWEIFAFVVAAAKRTPENIMPHIWQIAYSFIDPKPVANGMSCLQVVLVNAGTGLFDWYINRIRTCNFNETFKYSQ